MNGLGYNESALIDKWDEWKMMKAKVKSQGFSLIELLIVVVIVAILAAIAFPALSRYILKSNRTEGLTNLLSIQAAYEQYYSQNNKYPAANSLLPSGGATAHYTYSTTVSNTSPYYTITATGIGGQVNDKENNINCSPLTTDSTGKQTPPECWLQ